MAKKLPRQWTFRFPPEIDGRVRRFCAETGRDPYALCRMIFSELVNCADAAAFSARVDLLFEVLRRPAPPQRPRKPPTRPDA